jgi:hypothetical protein
MAQIPIMSTIEEDAEVKGILDSYNQVCGALDKLPSLDPFYGKNVHLHIIQNLYLLCLTGHHFLTLFNTTIVCFFR